LVEQVPVNKKRVLRLMREHHLLVRPNQQLKAKRAPKGQDGHGALQANPQPRAPLAARVDVASLSKSPWGVD
jgi:hypothetical protein